MHAATINLGELFIPLWRGQFQCAGSDRVTNWDWAVLKDAEVWKEHGRIIGDCRPYIPGSFDRYPHNIAEKVSSGYKAKEWQGYFYGLAPALLHNILPFKYWQNFCHLVYAMRIVHQRRVSASQLQEAYFHVQTFHLEFEELYVQRNPDCLHFVRPCLHALLHTPQETVRMGTITTYSTWTIERMVGDLGGEIRLHSDPYANLSERGLLRCQTNALRASFPELEKKDKGPPAYSEDLGSGYHLLRARDEYAQALAGEEGAIIKRFIEDEEEKCGNAIPDNWAGPRVRRWARLQLPSGQIARSAWKEDRYAQTAIRRARFLSLPVSGSDKPQIEFAEVKFYFNARINDVRRPLALISLLSRPDADLFEKSFWTVWSVTLQNNALRVIDAKCVTSVVAVIPHDHHCREDRSDKRFFIWEYTGLEMDLLSDATQIRDEDRDALDQDDEEVNE
ncbi:hypothetical protein CPB83DRAFT_803686 [Crepidotus variabilis]|uniref:Uncharacterized protein n=1 Tax=Crepidotus variabilis TaxID=179855 RepID=A0A9P6EUG0_9AGAR|nr:hypothetical protein CPB83DRAFT_803686 [Crepidotus variabilis]